jgi:hypothetical protein
MTFDTANDRALTVQQAADFLAVSEIVMLDMIARGIIPASNIGRGSQRPRWRILASCLGMYLVSTRQPAIEPAKPKRAVRQATKDYFAALEKEPTPKQPSVKSKRMCPIGHKNERVASSDSSEGLNQ